MKKLLVNFFSLIIFSSSFAQSEGVLNYKLSIKNTFGNNEVNRIIYFKGPKSIELGVPKRVEPSSEKISETEYKEVKVIKTTKKRFIFKDMKNKSLLCSENIMTKIFLISDTLNNFKWKITKEHKKILNYNCTKALVSFRGRNYTAWFSEQIPLPLGPWKFCGLPGLIIKISDDEEKFVYELTDIDLKAKFDLSILKIPAEYKNDKSLSHREFISIYNKKIKDFVKMSKVVYTFPNGGTGRTSITLPEEQEKF